MNVRWLRSSIFGAAALTMTLAGTGVVEAAGAPQVAIRAEVGPPVYQRRVVHRVVYRNGHRVVVRVVSPRPHHRYRHRYYRNHRYYYR